MKTLKEVIKESINIHGYCPTMTFKGNPNLMDISDDELMNMKVKSIKEVSSNLPESLSMVSLIIDLFI